MYCTLQEAYNVPSFAGKRRGARNMAPLAISQSGTQGVSANAFDPYGGEDGRGEQATYDAPPPAKRPGQESLREGFMCGSMGSDGTKGSKSFSYNNAAGANNTTYSSQSQDYDYYCKNFNICSTPKVQVTEGFEGAPVPNGANPKPAKQQSQCRPLQAPMYEIPVSDESKKAYAKAMDASMEGGSATQSAPMPMRNVDMSGVTGYYDDEIDQYMNTSDMAAAPMPSVPKSKPSPTNAPAEPYDPSEATPFSRIMTKISRDSKVPSSPAADKWQYIMDLALFISAGVLIIMLCEQLFKIAIAIGMRDTVHTLGPYLAEIAALKEQLQMQLKTAAE